MEATYLATKSSGAGARTEKKNALKWRKNEVDGWQYGPIVSRDANPCDTARVRYGIPYQAEMIIQGFCREKNTYIKSERRISI